MSKNSCEIIKDLLPLYIDNVCSPESQKMVQEHLAECPECQQTVQSMRKDYIESAVNTEKESILNHHAKAERSAAWKAGTIIAYLLCIPIGAITMVSAAGQTTWGVMPIVLFAMLLVASVTVVPLMSKQNRFSRSVLCATASILLIEFFVFLSIGESFAKAAVPTLFGLSVLFLPFVIKNTELPFNKVENKFVFIMGWDTALFFLTIFVVMLPSTRDAAFNEGMVTSVFLIFAVWVIAGISKISNSNLTTTLKIICSLIVTAIGIAFLQEAFYNINLSISGFLFNIVHWSPSAWISNIVLTLISSSIFISSILILVKTAKNIYEEGPM